MRSSKLLRDARLRAGLTQGQLARRAGTTQSAISRWERGGSTPGFETLARLVDACGLRLRVDLESVGDEWIPQIEQNLSLTSTERLDQLVRTVRFVEAGREAAQSLVRR